MAEVIAGLVTVATNSHHAPHDSDSWWTQECPHCGGPQVFLVASTNAGGQTWWLRCPVCLKGAVFDNGTMYPSAVPLRMPEGLPAADRAIWDEARACLGVGANAAAVMLCRKLLLHIAVASGLPAKNDKDRSPNFLQSVEHLQAQGIVTVKMRPWVDRIKDIGNDANHELTPIARGDAMDVATFTLQLLVLAYELDALMAEAAGEGPPATG